MEELFDLKDLGKLGEAEFLERPNRFVGKCKINKEVKTCHIADPGRLKEILHEGRKVLVVKNRPELKMDYKIVAAKMEDGWILLNTSFHSKIARKAIEKGVLGFIPKKIKSEVKFGNSRLDFFINNKIFVELKGSNLLIDKKCIFPDAPTERGRRHLEELIKAKEKGYRAVILFMGLRDCECFKTNDKLDKEFAETFKKALKKGVEFYGFKIKIDENFKVVLNGKLPLCNKNLVPH
jgi:sugar fermentation stimulation protein A